MYIQKTEIQYKLLSINIERSVLAIFGILVFAQDMGYPYSVWAVSGIPLYLMYILAHSHCVIEITLSPIYFVFTFLCLFLCTGGFLMHFTYR
jgi:hypothetical protein